MTEAYSYPLRLSELATKKPTRFSLTPDQAERAAIAETLGIPGIDSLTFKGGLAPKGRRDWALEAELTARVVQPCVVTTDPVKTDIAERVERLYVADLPEVEGDEIAMPEDDRIEALTASVDLGAVLTEALSLALPLYPRSEGAEFDDMHYAAAGTEALTDETAKPFAGLARLLKNDDDAKG